MLSFHSFRATGHSGGAVSRGHLLVCDFAAGLHSVSSSVDALVCQPPPIPHRHPSPLPTSADTGLQINRGESHVEIPSLHGKQMGKQGKQWLTLFWGAPKSLQMVTASMELKRRLLLGRKVMTNLDSIFKSRDITLPTKVRLVKAVVFPVVMYGCKSWTVKKAER